MYNADDLINNIKSDSNAFTLNSVEEMCGDDEWLRNCAVNTYEYVTQCERPSSFPIDVVLPTTCWCNARCIFCRYCVDDKYYLPIDAIDRYQLLLRYVKNFGLSGYGEPLLHPQFDQYAQAIYGRIDPRATMYLVTNGILLHRHLDTIKRYCKSVSVSLNAATAGVHAQVMDTSSRHFEKIIDSIRHLVSYRDLYDGKFLVQMSFAVIRDNLHQIPEFIKFAQRLRVNKIYFNTLNMAKPDDFDGRLHLTVNSYHDQRPCIHPEFETLWQRAVDAINDAKVPIDATPESWRSGSIYDASETSEAIVDKDETIHCSYLYQRLMITDCLETIRTCCFLNSPPGHNAVHFSEGHPFLGELGWNSPGMVAMRRAFARKQLPTVCKTCSTYEKNIFR